MDSKFAADARAGAAGKKIGWIGAGKMGAPMIRNLLAAGIPVSVSEPNPAAQTALAAAGATAAGDLSPIDGASIVFATLPNDEALRMVVAGTQSAKGVAERLAPGSVLVEMSTVSPECSAEVAKILDKAGIFYVRAPVSGSTTMAEKASLTILASGASQGWDAALPLLGLLSARQFWLGAGEEARYMKLVLNTLVGASSAILAEAVALGASGGLSRAAMMEVICESAVASPLFKYKTDLVVSEDYTPAFTIQQMIKDFTLISDAGRSNGVPLMTAGLILELYRTAANAGLQNEDFFALVKWHSGISAQQG
ncbi:NAD(P)-dependent oxidoreductase [Paragemmobacter straminiformis]|uniref:NAD(P)-dependent oxidoreductase n=1 Tax=Paragemmobacter straminiformis TaxID=2045119 RepID=A0A842I4T1_9RHOB|nr:NAD(P)-dependent oxidoreductase [Gemmobacter straminiformis]MBC2834619.1 NAD(P)-dependent oxidoreductase [Gemmobacter straminiformis]